MSTTKLASEKCEACRADSKHVTHEEVIEYMKDLSGWQIVEEDDLHKLSKAYVFKNWAGALEFTNKVGALAEDHGHHPSIITEWGRVTVRYWTHKIGGLHKNDFVMAAKTDLLAETAKS